MIALDEGRAEREVMPSHDWRRVSDRLSVAQIFCHMQMLIHCVLTFRELQCLVMY